MRSKQSPGVTYDTIYDKGEKEELSTLNDQVIEVIGNEQFVVNRYPVQTDRSEIINKHTQVIQNTFRQVSVMINYATASETKTN